jgi:hypothetical protein
MDQITLLSALMSSADPRTVLPPASVAKRLPMASQQPTSLQPKSTGMTATRSAFSMMP